MNPTLRRYLLWYTLVGGAITGALAFAAAVATNTPTAPIGLAFLLVTLLTVPFLVGVTDAGIETASQSAVIGHSTANPDTLQPSGLPEFDRAALVFYLVGVGLAGAALLAIYYA